MFLLVPAYPGSPGPRAVKRLCVCVCACVCVCQLYYCERILFKKDDCTMVLQRNMLQMSLLPYLMESSTAVKYSCTECAKKIPIYSGRCGVAFWGEQKLSKNAT